MNNLKKREQFLKEIDVPTTHQGYSGNFEDWRNENINKEDYIDEEFVFSKKSKEPKIEYRKDGRRHFKRNPSGGKWVEISKKEYDNNVNENMLPKPYKKVKCAECGEEVCDNLNYKIGHLYNKHNCKPSVNDYKAKRMLVQYFPPKLKESKKDAVLLVGFAGSVSIVVGDDDVDMFKTKPELKKLYDEGKLS